MIRNSYLSHKAQSLAGQGIDAPQRKL